MEPNANIDARLGDLERELEDVVRRGDFDGLKQDVDTSLRANLEDIDAHLNRHRCQILDHIDTLHADWPSR